jgi:UDPglucose 6-dehydrogenase
VIETLAPLLTEQTVIFGKSTVPVGTAKRVQAHARELAPAGDAVEV